MSALVCVCVCVCVCPYKKNLSSVVKKKKNKKKKTRPVLIMLFWIDFTEVWEHNFNKDYTHDSNAIIPI